MRAFIVIAYTIILFGCRNKAKMKEHDIFIVSLEKDFDKSGKLIIEDTNEVIQFSKGFWQYFIRTHPKSTGLIFIQPLLYKEDNYFTSNDTSLAFYNLASLNRYYFDKLLANEADSTEKDFIHGSAFFIPKDTSGLGEKERRVKKNLADYKLDDNIRQDYKKLKNILTGEDSSSHYIIVFKKRFAQEIYGLYE